MFTIYCKTVGGRRIDRYFRSWKNAKQALLSEAEDAKRFGWIVSHVDDYFNPAKGFYVYQMNGKTGQGEPFTLSLLDAYFED